MSRFKLIRECLECGHMGVKCDIAPITRSTSCQGFVSLSEWRARQIAWLEKQMRFHFRLMVFCAFALAAGALMWLVHGF